MLRQIHATWLGQMLDAGSQSDGMTLRGVVHAQVIPDLPHHNLT